MRRTIPALVAAAMMSVAAPQAFAHEAHMTFSAGEPGNPKKPARVVRVTMAEKGRRMLFEPATLRVRRGEQIRFVLTNGGIYDHEFMLASEAENRKHVEEMRKNPEMEHDDPNAIRLSPFNSGELVWRFSKRGVFEFACLIPGHLEAGMRGKVIVK